MTQKLMGSVVTVLEAPNLVANPSAAVEGDPGWPANWFHTLDGVAWATQGHADERALRLNPVNEMSDWRCEVVPVTGGKQYRHRVYVKGMGSQKTILALRWFSDDNGQNWISEEWMWLVDSYVDWTLQDAVWTAPLNARSADMMFRAFEVTTADLYGDDFYMGEIA